MTTVKKNFHNDHWVKPFMKKYARALCLSLFLGILTFFSAGALMFCSGYLISKAASLPMNILLIYVPIVLTRAFGIARPVFKYLESLTSHNWVLKMTSKMRVKLYRLLEKEAIFLKGKYQTGELLDILSEDINELQNLYLRTIFPTLVAIVIYAIGIICLGYFSLPFALLILILLAFVLFVIPMYALLAKAAAHEKAKVYQSRLYNDLTDNILGINDWVISRRKKAYITRHEHMEQQRTAELRQISRHDRVCAFLVQLVLCIVIIAMYIWATKMFQNSKATVDYIAAFVLIVFPLIDVFAPIPSAVEGLNIYADSVQRLNQLDKQEIKQPVNEVAPKITAPYKIQCINTSYRYNQTKYVLQNLNLQINPGEKIALLGKSGVGKSTLVSLIRGDFTPTKGQVLLNEQPTDHFGDQIAKYIGIIQQSDYLFNTSIVNNIRLGNEQISDEEVWQVLAKVGLKERIEKLPQGIYTTVAEAGFGFSGGEQQRLSLARLLITKAPIIILDEPTVGLDPVTERQILDLFFRELADKTILWITHHLQGVERADRIVFLENGKITMNNDYQTLLKENTHFQQLVAFEKA